MKSDITRNHPRKFSLDISLMLLIGLLSGCGDASTPVVPPPPTMTGTWNVVYETGAIARWEVVESNSAVTCTMYIADVWFVFAGSITSSGALDIGYTDAGSIMLYRGTVTADRRRFEGINQIKTSSGWTVYKCVADKR